ncbi:hypothetical protein F5X99DRAFT_402222 [Biscogniauxia marginata]|nr:hypothetical protein F5X99DRAFT_402222 [Biscogniauxia marginata]
MVPSLYPPIHIRFPPCLPLSALSTLTLSANSKHLIHMLLPHPLYYLSQTTSLNHPIHIIINRQTNKEANHRVRVRPPSTGILPEQTLQVLHAHILPHASGTLQTVKTQLATTLQRTMTAVQPLLEPLFERALLALQNSPDVVVLAFVVAFIVLIFQVVAWVHRTMMFFTRLALRMVFWAVLAGVLAVAWQRGPEAVIRDVVVFVSKIAGYVTVVREIWWSEYQRYDAQTRSASTAGAGSPRTASGYGGRAAW